MRIPIDMSTVANPFKRALKVILPKHGFRYDRGQWIRENDEIIQIVHLDKAPFGEKYYLDVGMFIRSLGLPDSLKERFAHYRVRLDHRVDKEFDELLFMFANIDVMDDGQRETRFSRLLEEKGVPILDMTMTTDGLIECYWKVYLSNAAVVRQASMLLFGSESMPKIRKR